MATKKPRISGKAKARKPKKRTGTAYPLSPETLRAGVSWLLQLAVEYECATGDSRLYEPGYQAHVLAITGVAPITVELNALVDRLLKHRDDRRMHAVTARIARVTPMLLQMLTNCSPKELLNLAKMRSPSACTLEAAKELLRLNIIDLSDADTASLLQAAVNPSTKNPEKTRLYKAFTRLLKNKTKCVRMMKSYEAEHRNASTTQKHPLASATPAALEDDIGPARGGVASVLYAMMSVSPGHDDVHRKSAEEWCRRWSEAVAWPPRPLEPSANAAPILHAPAARAAVGSAIDNAPPSPNSHGSTCNE
jgi:hypothetical protein